MTARIEITNLSIKLQGRTMIDDLSFAVEPGDVFGLLGPSGAGKTCLMRALVTLLKPAGGDILVGGYSVKSSPEMVREITGYIPGKFGVYSHMSVWEYLDFFGACSGIAKNESRILINDLLELVELQPRKDQPAVELSSGMKQRLSIARALLHDPKVLVFENPLADLDPLARVEFRDLIFELGQLGKTVIYSSNHLSDINAVCSRVGILDKGKLIAYGSIQALGEQIKGSRILEITVMGDGEKTASMLSDNPFISNTTRLAQNRSNTQTNFQIEYNGDDENLAVLFADLAQAGIKVLNFNEISTGLEKIFRRAVKGNLHH